MATLYKLQVLWGGFIGAPGYSTFYQSALPTDNTPYRDFFNAIAAGIPNIVTFSYPNLGVTVDEETGETNGFWSAPPVANSAGASAADYAAGVGISVRWDTATIRDGHRVKGHTYIVPTVGPIFDTNGTVDESYRTTVATAAAALNTALAGSLKVWSRPKPGRVGQACTIVSYTCPDKAAIMRSRRD